MSDHLVDESVVMNEVSPESVLDESGELSDDVLDESDDECVLSADERDVPLDASLLPSSAGAGE